MPLHDNNETLTETGKETTVVRLTGGIWFPNPLAPSELETEFPQLYEVGRYKSVTNSGEQDQSPADVAFYTLMGDGTVNYQRIQLHTYDRGMHTVDRGIYTDGKIETTQGGNPDSQEVQLTFTKLATKADESI